MAGFDAVFVGSGINSLAGGALLAKDGWRVCVLERNDWLGGAIKTVEELTAPASPTKSSLLASAVGRLAGLCRAKAGSRRLGLEYLNTDLPTAPRSRTGRAHSSRPTAQRMSAELGDAWQQQFDEFMAGAEIAFGVLGTELWSAQGFRSAARPTGSSAARGLVEFAGTRCSPHATG